MIDVDRLEAIIRTNLNADTRDGPACRQLISLARVGAAAVDRTKCAIEMNHCSSHELSNRWATLDREFNVAIRDYLAQHKEARDGA